MSPEMIGYLNMAIGLGGIVLTVLSTPALLHLGAKVRTDALPTEFQGVGGAIRTVGVLLVLTTFIFLLALGMTTTLAPITESMGAAYPVLVAVLIVGAIFSTATTLALAIYKNPLVIPGIVGSLALILLALVAGITEDRGVFGLVVTFSVMGFLGAGFLGLLGLAEDEDEAKS